MSLGATCIEKALARSEAALIGYLPVGFPTVDQSIEAGKVLADEGFDMIELGFPYSDPGMDGPVIQRATEQALHAGVHLTDLLRATEELSNYGITVSSMTYWNPVFWYGVEQFARDFASAGGAGLITPDLPPEEGSEWEAAAETYDLDRIYLVAPSSPEHRLRKIVNHHRGWIYAASTMGVTGTRTSVDDAARELVARTRAAGADYVCVGLGVSTGAQAREIAAYADGVIVGSALVRQLFAEADGLSGLRALAAELRSGAVRSS
ncbi:MAG: tryptophan synthase subunit alpha [Actinomycetaceae bacterium]|nr:tryptophan synthase subunit alpha [Actinomycetaceae bacterium]